MVVLARRIRRTRTIAVVRRARPQRSQRSTTVARREWMSSMSMTEPSLIARHYQHTRERILAALSEPGVDWNAPVPACPKWSARDVVAHLTAVAEDWVDGTLTGPPTDDQTAAQVARFDGYDHAGIIEAWTAAAERLDQYAETAGVAPPLGDLACHEHDVRGA